MNLFDLTGKVALVTGSTKGIGEAIVHRMAEHGAKVVVSSRKADACEKVAADINKAHGADVAAPIACNINYKEQLQNLVAQTRAKWGRIDVLRGSPVLGAYCISKAADFQLARNIAVEYGPYNIRANAIAPGLIKTDFAKALWDNPETLKRSTAGAPLRRIGEPDEIAGAAVFLASKAGSFMTGQAVVVDGGATI